MTAPFSWTTHLSEDRLFECYLAERGPEGIDPLAADHLAECDACRSGYDDLTRLMEEMWTVADQETSAVFTPERLRLQQDQIARRLEMLGHPARVISFPAHLDAQAPTAEAIPARTSSIASAVSRIGSGWLAAAAVAGLIVGATAGLFYDSRTHARAVRDTQASAVRAVDVLPAATPAVAQAEPQPQAADDDMWLMFDVESAHERPRTPELMALETFTPHVREISYIIR